jgi:hypothetical protein
MAKTVFFSKRARNSLEKLLTYLESEWSLKVYPLLQNQGTRDPGHYPL